MLHAGRRHQHFASYSLSLPAIRHTAQSECKRILIHSAGVRQPSAEASLNKCVCLANRDIFVILIGPNAPFKKSDSVQKKIHPLGGVL
jgi:hypothetical protein